METMGMLVLLIPAAIMDLQKRRVSLWQVALCGICAAVYQWFCGWRLLDYGLALLPGILLFAAAHLTGQRVGTGDGLVFCGAGLILGFTEGISLLFTTCTLLLVIGVGGLLFCKDRKRELPMIPLILAAYLLDTIAEGIG